MFRWLLRLHIIYVISWPYVTARHSHIIYTESKKEINSILDVTLINSNASSPPSTLAVVMYSLCHAPPLGQRALSHDARMTFVCRVHRAEVENREA